MIELAGFHIDAAIRMNLSTATPRAICSAMATCLERTGRALERLKPDLLLVTGDRYELLPLCSAALVLDIPVAHISGGDVTAGAIDNQVRHAITKMACIHFPGNRVAARRIIRMGEHPNTVFMVGEPGLESFRRTPQIARSSLARKLGLDTARKWVLFTYHPETLAPLEINIDRVRVALSFLREKRDCQTVLLDANADFGTRQISAELARTAAADSTRFRLLHNLQPHDYTNYMRHAYVMIGNSSAGLLEAPSAHLPVIDIGDRQKGRLRAANVVHASGDLRSLQKAWIMISSTRFRRRMDRLVNPFGDGQTGARIASILARIDPKTFRQKSFYDAGQ